MKLVRSSTASSNRDGYTTYRSSSDGTLPVLHVPARSSSRSSKRLLDCAARGWLLRRGEARKMSRATSWYDEGRLVLIDDGWW